MAFRWTMNLQNILRKMSNDDIDAIIESILKKRANIVNLSDTEYLINILDSIDIIGVILDLEDALDIEIDEWDARKLYNSMKVCEAKAFCRRLKENSENDK